MDVDIGLLVALALILGGAILGCKVLRPELLVVAIVAVMTVGTIADSHLLYVVGDVRSTSDETWQEFKHDV